MKRQPSIVDAFASAAKRIPAKDTEDADGYEPPAGPQPPHSPGQRRVDPDAQCHVQGSAGNKTLDVLHATGPSCNLPDEEKYALIERRKPSESTVIPSRAYKDRRRASGSTVRQCNRAWFDQFPFTAYSEKAQGIFCLPCVLFPVCPSNPGAVRAQFLITKPLTNWKDAREDLLAHAALDYHVQADAKLNEFVRVHDQPSGRLDNLFTTEAQATVEANRAVPLTSIAKCVEWCARQGIALRGHRDDSTSTTLIQGNFRALVSFRAAADMALAKHLKCADKNATYVSKTVQNDLLEVMEDYVLSKIVEGVRVSGFFGLQADEVTDARNWEQLGVVIRYIKGNKPTERLLAYADCESIRGEAIFRKLVDVVSATGINLQLCRAQAYDGAGNMAGSTKGCQARFLEAYPLAKYYHCASHQLNLALSRSCQQKEVHIMMENLKKVGLFFQFSPKRERQLESSVTDANSEGHSIHVKKVKTLCETRWVERHTALEDFAIVFPALLMCLETISSSSTASWDSKAITEASGLLHMVASDSFIAGFQTCLYFSGYLKALSILLQGSSLDVLLAYEEVNLVRSTLQEIRDGAEREFKPVYEEMCRMAEQAHGKASLVIPRRCGRQTQRSNVPADSPEDYWRCTVFVPFLDHLLQELKARFTGMTQAAVRGLCLLPERAKNMDVARASENLIEAFHVDLPDQRNLPVELRLWKGRWKAATQHPPTLEDTLAAIAGQELVYPNVVQVLKLLLVTPVTTASVERANSALDFIKSDRRSTMTERRLNALLTLFVHKDIPVDLDKVVNLYATKHPRRMLLVKPLEV